MTADATPNEVQPDAAVPVDGSPIDGSAIDGSAIDGSEEANALEADLAELAAERDELRVLAQRVQADFENYRKRVLREQTLLVERASEGLVEQLLPVVDSFVLALASLEGVEPGVRKGVELGLGELLAVLERAGLERMAPDGHAFDPTEHEAVLQEEDPADGPPVVVETLRPGYRLKGRVLRPAMVKVGRRSDA